MKEKQDPILRMTASEKLLTEINLTVFFKEFTYAQTQLKPTDGNTKELADNVIWLDDLLFVYQVKGREPNAVTDQQSEEKWFNNKVVDKAKKQIKDTVSYFKTYKSLPILNERGQQIDVSAAKREKIVKIVIYDPNSSLLEIKRRMMFLESSSVGQIHLFHIADYQLICGCLITPAELASYLQFREEMYSIHKDMLGAYSENYLLGHFLTDSKSSTIIPAFEDNVEKLKSEPHLSAVAHLINNFKDKLVMYRGNAETDYHNIIKEIAKLNRHELYAFIERYSLCLEVARANEKVLPNRFASGRTECGFVFISLPVKQSEYWENALLNWTEGFKYKHKLPRCIGVIMFKLGEFYEIRWTYTSGAWEFDSALDRFFKEEAEFYSSGEKQDNQGYSFQG